MEILLKPNSMTEQYTSKRLNKRDFHLMLAQSPVPEPQ